MQRQCTQIVRKTAIRPDNNPLDGIIGGDDPTTAFKITVNIKILLHGKRLSGFLYIQDPIEGIDQIDIFRFPAFFPVSIGVVGASGDDIPTAVDYFYVIRFYFKTIWLRTVKTLMSDVKHPILSHGLRESGKPKMTGRNIFKKNSLLQMFVCLYLVECSIRIDEPVA